MGLAYRPEEHLSDDKLTKKIILNFGEDMAINRTIQFDNKKKVKCIINLWEAMREDIKEKITRGMSNL